MHRANQFYSILAISLVGFITQIGCDEILGCGGFIKSHADIDFSRVEVKLLTKQGSLKDKTDCSPSNGYYFLPVYDKGEYTLKISPPPGWSFEPEQIDINFDGKTDVCSRGQDVNFAFKGFGITGQITDPTQSKPVKDVNVVLRSASGDDVRQTVSDANGIFSFTPVIPGQYTIKVNRDNWHFVKPEHSVTVTAGNTELPKDAFVVSGYDVRGKISSDGVQNIGFLLFNAKNQRHASKCLAAPTQSTVTANHNGYEAKPSCSAVTTANGDFEFGAIAPGKYLVRPLIQNKNIQFQIQPEFIEFVVTNEPIRLTQNFEITGFSVFGRVLSTANGFGVGNAKIILNGEYATTTHTDGSYTLKNIKADTYTITAEADDVEFTERTVKISMASPSIPDIVVSAFKVCGQVLSQDSYTIAITKHASTFHTQAQSQKSTGEWCTYLPSGRYSIQILTSTDDTAQGIQFFPKVQNIDVAASPVSGITFSQLRATVTGDVKCLADVDGASHCKSITITLHSLDVDGKRSGHTVQSALKNGKYSFVDVLPGTYEVSVPTNLLCWESNTLALNVKSATEVVPTFVHTGYLVSVTSSHNTAMSYQFHTTQPQQAAPPALHILLAPGLSSFCVDKFGQYDVTFTGCHTYETDTPRSFHTGDEIPLAINAIKHSNTIRILSDVRSTFKVLVEQGGAKRYISPTEEDQKINGQFSYRYRFDLRPNERLTLTPESEIVLFSPAKAELIGADDCVENVLTFSAAKGLIINGKVTPPIADVKVTLSFPQNPELAALEVLTSAAGQFKFGPLDSQLAVALSAYKESYVFSEYDTSRNEFKAHKLCEIIATVTDEQGAKLAGVLLSLSGAESYRKNLVTDENGTIKFHSLSPSQYFLRPMMKEYRFEPASKIIDIKDGETVRVELNGRRVSFSVFGSVNTLNGEPFADVIVEARSEDRCGQHQEEATTEPNGQYRIRGLQPGCAYTIRVRTDGETAALVDRTIPAEHQVTVNKEDVHNIDIVAISPISYVDVIARINAASNEHYKTLRVQLYKKEVGPSDNPIYSQRVESPLNVKSRVNPGIMVFFPRIPFDGKTYVVELTTTLSDKNYRYTLPVQTFEANRSTIYLELDFKPEIRLSEGDLNQNSISALILLGLVIIAFFKQDLAADFLSLVWTKLSTVANTAIQNAQKKKDNRHEVVYNESEIEKLAQSINATKKKSARKT